MVCGQYKIDLGGCATGPAGYICVDIDDYSEYYEEGMFIRHDLRKGLPFCSDSCIEIRCNAMLSFFTPDETIWIINECWRVLKKGGVMEIMARSEKGDFTPPIHKQTFNKNSFNYLVKKRAFWWKDNPKRWEILQKEERSNSFYFRIVPVKK